jgi:hypothetical protein
MMTMMSTSGLMVISQMGSFAKDFGVTSAMVFGMAALSLVLTIDRFTNGLTRPFFGWVSDRIGRENTMRLRLAFGLEGMAMIVWLATRDNAVMFMLVSGVVFFGWAEIFYSGPAPHPPHLTAAPKACANRVRCRHGKCLQGAPFMHAAFPKSAWNAPEADHARMLRCFATILKPNRQEGSHDFFDSPDFADAADC